MWPSTFVYVVHQFFLTGLSLVWAAVCRLWFVPLMKCLGHYWNEPAASLFIKECTVRRSAGKLSTPMSTFLWSHYLANLLFLIDLVSNVLFLLLGGRYSCGTEQHMMTYLWWPMSDLEMFHCSAQEYFRNIWQLARTFSPLWVQVHFVWLSKQKLHVFVILHNGRQLQIVGQLRGFIKSQYRINKDFFELPVMQSHSIVVPE